MSITRSSALVLASCASLQFGAATAVGLFDSLGTWGVTFLRLTVAGVLLLLVARPAVGAWTRGDWRAVALFAVMMAGMNGFFYASLDRIPMSAAVAIEFTGPLVYAAVTSRNRGDLLWVGLAAAGMAVLGTEALTGEGLDPVGMLLALVAGVFWVGYIVGSGAVGRRIPGTGGLAVAMLLGGLMMAPVGRGAVEGVTAEPWLLVPAVVTALMASVIPYSLELAALRRLPAAVFSVLISLEPAFAALAGFLLLDQQMTVLRGVTVVLVISASVGITWSAQRRVERQAPSSPTSPSFQPAGSGRRPRRHRRTPSPL